MGDVGKTNETKDRDANIAGGYAMKAKILPALALATLLASFFVSSSCGNGPGNLNCPVCGTDKNGTVQLIDVMIVPEHNPNGEPGGPFNIFDISWVDPVNRLYYVSDRIGLDVPMFSTVTNTAIFAIGGDNSVAEAGNNASTCFQTGPAASPTQIIPPITSPLGNYTRFGCKTMNFRLPGFFGPNGHFGGYMGGQCCASRSNNLNPLSGPNGLEVSVDGNFLFTGNGSSSFVIYDLRPTLANNGTAPTVIAVIPTGSTPDYDGPNGIVPCQGSANGRAFSDPTCGDLRGDELATTGGFVTAADGNKHFLVGIINGDPGLPFFTIVDVTGVINGALNPVANPTPQQLQLEHCLPVNYVANPTAPYSPGGGNNSTIGNGPNTFFSQNYPSCIVGQIYYDGAAQNNQNVPVDDIGLNGPTGGPGISNFACPDPSLQFIGTPGVPGAAVPSGVSGHGVGLGGAEVPCHHGPIIDINTGMYDPTCNPTAAGAICQGAVSPAGLGGMVFNPNTGHFLLTNSNSTANITVGSVDEIDPRIGNPNGPVVINSFPILNCMPTGDNIGPGTDVLIGCADHDGRAFAPSEVIINGTTGEILTTINQVGFVDETWFNPGDNRYYTASRDMPTGPVLGVIDAINRVWLQNVSTNGNAHSVGADPVNNHIYVPLPSGSTNCQSAQADGCVGVYARD